MDAATIAATFDWKRDEEKQPPVQGVPFCEHFYLPLNTVVGDETRYVNVYCARCLNVRTIQF